MARIVVERIDADPTLFNVARENHERWRRLHGTLSRANEEWVQILNRSWSEIRAILLEESDEGQRLRSTHPFRGIVTEEERLAIMKRHPPPWPFVPYDPSPSPQRGHGKDPVRRHLPSKREIALHPPPAHSTMIEPVARIRIELQEIEPRIWRRIDVPLSSTLLALHDFVQFAFRWTDSHLFEFEVGDRNYGDSENDDFGERRVYKASSIRLKTVLDRGIEQFLYVYDFGDTTGDTTSSLRRSGTGSPTSTTRYSSRASGGALRKT